MNLEFCDCESDPISLQAELQVIWPIKHGIICRVKANTKLDKVTFCLNQLA